MMYMFRMFRKKHEEEVEYKSVVDNFIKAGEEIFGEGFYEYFSKNMSKYGVNIKKKTMNIDDFIKFFEVSYLCVPAWNNDIEKRFQQRNQIATH